MSAEKRKRDRRRFLFKNLGRGLAWLSVIVILFVVLKDNPIFQNESWLNAISGNKGLVYLVFLLSEVIFGIFPPELFMIWSIDFGVTGIYVSDVLILSVISYGAGVFGYYIGNQFSHLPWYKKVEEKYLSKYRRNLRRYSGFILFVGAVTPLPFSAMCMLAGSIHFPFKTFLLITLTRFARFFVYGYFIWQANAF